MKTKERFILTLFAALVLWLVFLAVGCGSGLVPTEHQQAAALTTADNINSQQALTIQKAISGSPPPNVTISGTNNTTYLSPGIPVQPRTGVTSEDLPPSTTYQELTTVTSGSTQKAGSKAEQTWYDEIRIPLGVKIAMLAVGLAMLVAVVGGAIWWARHSSAAVNAAWEAADQQAAKAIQRLEAKVASTTDAAAKAALLQEKAELEKERGKLNAA